MRPIWCISIMVLLTCSCCMLPESGDEHDEANLFLQTMERDARMQAIFDGKPNRGMGMFGASCVIYFYYNAPAEYAFPGEPTPVPNWYSESELKVIAAVLQDTARQMKIRRKVIMVHDDEGEEERLVWDGHKAITKGQ